MPWPLLRADRDRCTMRSKQIVSLLRGTRSRCLFWVGLPFLLEWVAPKSRFNSPCQDNVAVNVDIHGALLHRHAIVRHWPRLLRYHRRRLHNVMSQIHIESPSSFGQARASRYGERLILLRYC
ncbi:hypothetical protein BDN71DRAFT_367749 [Pleurotus eryngii]|uniref:Uncharacterized protein n=1 Tax=Pleurotus eryngii TaxID=5323 RepID=A0A9P5ZJ67_PLEER|nr:hypothetical protein BDN71DRAFT_367749 [Pleurotus eryngii]